MTRKLTRVDDQPFPGTRDLTSAVYEWHSPSPRKTGTICVRFLSPIEEDFPRRFYVEDILNGWFQHEPPRFLEKACRVGSKVSFPQAKEAGDYVRVMLAIFRHRHDGHFGIRRQFRQAADFVDTDSREILVPGLGVSDVENIRVEQSTRIQLSNKILRSAIDKTPGTARGNIFQALCDSIDLDLDPATRNQISPLQLLCHAGAGQVLSAIIPGAEPQQAVDIPLITVETIRRSFTYGPNSIEDVETVLSDAETVRHFYHRLLKKERDTTPTEFAAWLKNEREHGFTRLLPSIRVNGPVGSDERLLWGKQLWCALLWDAYCLAAQCYEMLMTTILVDIVAELKLDRLEFQLFQQMHLSQRYLGGLPLDFLGREQLAFIVQPLTQLWRSMDFRPAPYDELTKLLGIFVVLVEGRRSVDRVVKLGSIQSQHSEDALEDLGEPVHLTTKICTACSKPWKLIRRQHEDSGTRIILTLFCPSCEKRIKCWVTKEELERLA